MAQVKLDDLDIEIAKLLQEDGRRTNADVARLLGLTESKVRRKIQRLVEQGTLRPTIIPNPYHFGFEISAYIGLHVDISRIKDIVATLKERPEVTFISTVTGRYDLLIWVELRNLPELRAFIEEVLAKLEGLRGSETLIILDINKLSMARVR